jgi:hypothetical protein
MFYSFSFSVSRSFQMPAELLQEVTYDAQGRVISMTDLRPCTCTTYYFDKTGHLIPEGDAAEDEQADETNIPCRTHTYEAQDILAADDDWADGDEINTDDIGTGTGTGLGGE